MSSPDAAQEIMKTHDLIFANRPKMSLGKRLLYDYKDVSVAPYGEYWRQMRSICVLHLLSNKRVQSFNTVRREEISLLIQKIEEFSSLSTSMDLSGMFMRLTNDVICRVAFGRKYSGDERGKKFRRLLGEFVELLGGFNVGDYIPWLAWVEYVNGWSAKVERVAKEFDEFLDGVVEEHLDGGSGSIAKGDNEKDFVDVLLEIQRDGTLGFSMDRDSIKALILVRILFSIFSTNQKKIIMLSIHACFFHSSRAVTDSASFFCRQKWHGTCHIILHKIKA